MKIKITLFLSLMFVFGACKKDDDEQDVNKPASNPTNVPSTFTQKVLLEEFTATWCATGPDFDYKRDQLINTYPGKVIATTIHETDAMEILLIWTLDDVFHTNFPSGMINRLPQNSNVILTQNQWMYNATVALQKFAKCGLKINSSVSSPNATIDVHVGFNQTLSGTYNMAVYLVENNVVGTGSGYDQANAYNSNVSSPFYNFGNPIINYHHNYVVRKVLTALLGDVIDPATIITGGEFIKSFSADISSYNQNELYVVAFVDKEGNSANTHEIMNVQQAKIGTFKDWD